MVDTQSEFIARIGPDGRLSFVNDAYCRYYGQSRETLLGREFNEFTGTLPEDRERDAAHLQALTPATPSRTIELRRQLPDGRVAWVQWADTALFDDEEQLVEIQSVGRDITDQRNSELALRASEASYRALVETQTEFVLRLRPDGRLTFVNEAYCRYVNTSREEMLRSGWNDLDMVAPEDRAAYEKHLRALTPDQSHGGHRDSGHPARWLRAMGGMGRHGHFRRRRRARRDPVGRPRRHGAQAGRARACARARLATGRWSRRRPSSFFGSCPKGG